MNNIEIKTLEGVSIAKLAASWNRGFSDYAVSLEVTESQLESKFRQNGVRFDASIGAFDGNELVGIWMNGVRTVDGELSAYDSGTAIWPEYRSKGISKNLANKSTEVLRTLDVRVYILEVLSDNERAFNVYRGDGFEITRKFDCYKTKNPSIDVVFNMDDIKFKEGKLEESIIGLLPDTEYRPSWQNSMPSLLEASDRMHIISAWKADRIVGYGIVETDRGRIPQIGFETDYWDTALPSVILKKLCMLVPADREIAIINIEDTASNTIRLFTGHGFEDWARQYEMKKRLK